MQNNQNTPLLLSVVYGIIRSTKAGDRPSPETKGNEDESQGNQGQKGLQGIQGPQGNTTTLTGSQGYQGTQGDKGYKGALTPSVSKRRYQIKSPVTKVTITSVGPKFNLSEHGNDTPIGSAVIQYIAGGTTSSVAQSRSSTYYNYLVSASQIYLSYRYR